MEGVSQAETPPTTGERPGLHLEVHDPYPSKDTNLIYRWRCGHTLCVFICKGRWYDNRASFHWHSSVKGLGREGAVFDSNYCLYLDFRGKKGLERGSVAFKSFQHTNVFWCLHMQAHKYSRFSALCLWTRGACGMLLNLLHTDQSLFTWLWVNSFHNSCNPMADPCQKGSLKKCFKIALDISAKVDVTQTLPFTSTKSHRLPSSMSQFLWRTCFLLMKEEAGWIRGHDKHRLPSPQA